MEEKEIDNLILEKELGNYSFGAVFLASIKGDNKTKLVAKRLEREFIEGSLLLLNRCRPSHRA